VSFVSRLATGKPTARDDKKGASSAEYPTQAKTGLEWGTQPLLPVNQAGDGIGRPATKAKAPNLHAGAFPRILKPASPD
jgi:hypothetical protein